MKQEEMKQEEMKFETLNDHYVMQNKYMLVTPREDRKVLQNGISVQDTKDRKDIVVGIIECSHPNLKIPSRALVWFPRYAGLPLHLCGKQYLVVNHEDVIMIEKVHQI